MTLNFAGALVEETYPSGRTVKNTFRADGDLAGISSRVANGQYKNYASNFSYTAAGIIDKLQLGNGRWETAKLNERQQITELALGTSQTDTSLWKVNYDYGELNTDGTTVDAAKNTGNIAKQTISFSGLANPFVQTYKYDSVNRLTEAKELSGTNQTWKQTYSYDRFGNRSGFYQKIGNQELPIDNHSDPQIDQTTNRFAASQGYGYDKNGNIITDADGRQFVFNGENKQTEVRDANNNVIGQYFYDGEGKRVKKVTATETVTFVYSGGKLVAEYSSQPPPPNPTTSYTATDPLGSPRVITDKTGAVVSRRDFMPFGEELLPEGVYRTTNQNYTYGDTIRQKFTGYQKDEETQLDYAEARYYNNKHARFTAVDPLLASGKSANPQSFNRYSYVINNPLILVDPTGLQAGTSKTESKIIIDVFITFQKRDLQRSQNPNWKQLQREAAKNGSQINVYYSENKLSGNDIIKSLETPGRYVIVIGHSFGGEGQGINTGVKILSNDKNGKVIDYQTIGTNGLTTSTLKEEKGGYLSYVNGKDGISLVKNEALTDQINAQGSFFISCFPGFGFEKIFSERLNGSSSAYFNNPTNNGGTTLVNTGLSAGYILAQALSQGKNILTAVGVANTVLATDPGGDDHLQSVRDENENTNLTPPKKKPF